MVGVPMQSQSTGSINPPVWLWLQELLGLNRPRTSSSMEQETTLSPAPPSMVAPLGRKVYQDRIAQETAPPPPSPNTPAAPYGAQTARVEPRTPFAPQVYEIVPPSPSGATEQASDPVGQWLQSLQGLQVPASPEPQRIGTPPPPRQPNTQVGNILRLLLASGGGGAPQLPPPLSNLVR
jgi:hypothetical protein